MENLNMDMFKTAEEIEQEEQEQATQEVMNQYDRILYCPDPARIAEVVNNVFLPAQALDENNNFFEATDNYIKWSLGALSTNPSQFLIVEGLLSHRSKANLLLDMYADELGSEFRVLPGNNPILRNTAFLGGIPNQKVLADVQENVIRVAGIPVDEASENIAIFQEPLNAALPNMTGFVIALINLTDLQMSNLKKASKLKKVANKTQKVVQNLNTTGYALAKTALEGVVTPAMQAGGRLGGLAIGTMGTATFKATATAVGEITGAIARADIRNCREIQDIKQNCATIAMQFGRNKQKDDSFSFNF